MGFAPVLLASGRKDRGFDETYRGHRIIGAAYHSRRSRGDGIGTWRVSVDGRPLHLMRRADGSWMTTVDHYTSYATPLAAARGAVDELGPTARLRTPDGNGGHRHGLGGRGDGSGTRSGSMGTERDHRRGVRP
jgi:hypothetical protein